MLDHEEFNTIQEPKLFEPVAIQLPLLFNKVDCIRPLS